MPANDYYDHGSFPSPNAPGVSAALRSELELIEAGFNKMPTITGNGYKMIRVNAAGTALEAVADINNVTINGVVIGGTTAAAGSFTELSATSATITGALSSATLAVSGAGAVTGDMTVGGNLAVTGTATFTGAAYGPTATLGTSNTQLATTKFVADTAFSSALPAQTGNDYKFARTVAGVTSWSELGNKGADIASAATINLTTATGDYVHITGTTTITDITIPVGAERTVIFDGILTLTHGAALLLPGVANITTAANDRMTVRGDTAGAIVTSYTKADGTAVKSGMVYLGAVTTSGGAANIDFLTICSATYDTYFIDATNLISSADDSLYARVAVAGAAVTSSDYATTLTFEALTSTLATGMAIATIKSTATCSGRGVTLNATLQNVNTVTGLKTLTAFSYTQYAATPSFTATAKIGSYIGANVVTGFRLYCNGGSTFAAGGVVRVYGYSKT